MVMAPEVLVSALLGRQGRAAAHVDFAGAGVRQPAFDDHRPAVDVDFARVGDVAHAAGQRARGIAVDDSGRVLVSPPAPDTLSEAAFEPLPVNVIVPELVTTLLVPLTVRVLAVAADEVMVSCPP